MKKFQTIAALLLLAFLSGCGDAAAQTEEAPIPPPENTTVLTSTDEPTEAADNEIFTNQAEILSDYDVNEFPVTSEKAMSDLIDALVLSEKWQENFTLICAGMVTLNKEAYYQITLSTENEFSYSVIAAFWVSADSGAIYLKFDPTLDKEGFFSEYSDNIPENDYRTRLIAFP